MQHLQGQACQGTLKRTSDYSCTDIALSAIIRDRRAKNVGTTIESAKVMIDRYRSSMPLQRIVADAALILIATSIE